MVNPFLKRILKDIVKEAAKQVMNKGASYGLSEIIKGNVTELDAINVLRAKQDRRMITPVAMSLGITNKELHNITNNIRSTKARRTAVTGRNYIKNVNKYSNVMHTSISEYKQTELAYSAQPVQTLESRKVNAKLDALKLLEKEIQQIEPSFKFSDKIWANAERIEYESIEEVYKYLDTSFYYVVDSFTDMPVFLDVNHTGDKGGMYLDEWQNMIEDMLLQGYHITPNEYNYNTHNNYNAS